MGQEVGGLMKTKVTFVNETIMINKLSRLRRKIFYLQLIKYVEDREKLRRHGFLCCYEHYELITWLLLGLPCWTEMEEVQELWSEANTGLTIFHKEEPTCNGPCFLDNTYRIRFLKTCLKKLNYD